MSRPRRDGILLIMIAEATTGSRCTSQPGLAATANRVDDRRALLPQRSVRTAPGADLTVQVEPTPGDGVPGRGYRSGA